MSLCHDKMADIPIAKPTNCKKVIYVQTNIVVRNEVFSFSCGITGCKMPNKLLFSLVARFSAQSGVSVPISKNNRSTGIFCHIA